MPDPGATHFVLFTLPTPADLAAAGENPALHATASIDYVIVVSGTVAMELDDGGTVTLHPDVVVQNGTRHAWHNAGHERAVLAAVLVGTPPGE